MAKYEHKGSVHMFKKKSSVGEIVGGIIVWIIIILVIGSILGG